jgi:hypothetical protein
MFGRDLDWLSRPSDNKSFDPFRRPRHHGAGRQAAIVLRKRAAIVPQHAHASMCRSTVRRRAGVRSPSR